MSYPLHSDDSSYDLVNAKHEFRDHHIDAKRDFVYLEPHQLFLRNYISKYTPYDSILVYHNVGSGKSCTAIAIAEGFKEYLVQMNRKIVVLVKNKNILKNFTNELQTACASGYTETEPSGVDDNSKRRVLKEIGKYYQFFTYGTFVNKVLGARDLVSKKRRVQSNEPSIDFSNTVVIVDEAHNVTGNDVYHALHKVLKNSHNHRLVLLTATPVYDNPKEIFELANLLDTSLELPIRGALFKTQPPLVKRQFSKYINSAVLRNGIVNLTDEGSKVLSKVLKGRVTYLGYNPETFPKKLELGSRATDRKGSVTIVPCEMSEYQFSVYKQAIVDDRVNSLDEERDETIHIDFTKVSSLYKNSSDASTMVYPDGLYGKEGFTNYFQKKNKRYRPTDSSILTSGLQTYSTKLHALLQNLNQSPGPAFVFSHFVNYGGTALLATLLLENGYTEFQRQGRDSTRPAFVVFDDSVSIEMRERLRKIFNSPENKNGDIIKVVIGSPVMSEGITLKNVRQVHILEPAWNMARIEQIVGRAFRNYSHAALNPEERTLDVFKYVARYSGATLSTDQEETREFFIDMEKYILSEEKDRANKVVERILKEIAIDCVANKSRNQQKSAELNDTAACDYGACEYTCASTQLRDDFPLDSTTFHYYIDFFANYEIELIERTLPALFKQHPVWELNDIVSAVHKLYKVNVESIYHVLGQFVQSKTILQDAYDRTGYLIRAGMYYIFNPDSIDVHSSMFAKALQFSEMVNTLTLEEYMLSKFGKDMRQKKKTLNPKPAKKKVNAIFPNPDLVKDWDIYGTYYGRLGKKDSQFRIVDGRNKNTSVSDKRKVVTGMVCSSYKKGDLMQLAKDLGINTANVSLEKEQLCKLIEQRLAEQGRVLN
jgi:superfamily II DNA or RNA helicase